MSCEFELYSKKLLVRVDPIRHWSLMTFLFVELTYSMLHMHPVLKRLMYVSDTDFHRFSARIGLEIVGIGLASDHFHALRFLCQI